MSIVDDQNILRAIHRYVAACGGNTNEAEHAGDAILSFRELSELLDKRFTNAVERASEEAGEAVEDDHQKELAEAQRERDEARGNVAALKKRVVELTGELNASRHRLERVRAIVYGAPVVQEAIPA